MTIIRGTNGLRMIMIKIIAAVMIRILSSLSINQYTDDFDDDQ